MFDNLKDMYNLRKEAQEMEKQLKSESVEGQAGNVRIVINGKHDLLEVQIIEDSPLDRKDLARNFKEAYAQAQSKLQKILVQKFKGMM